MILSEFERLASPVSKTGGIEERRAFEFLRQYVREKLQTTPSPFGRGQGEGSLSKTVDSRAEPLSGGDGGVQRQ
jgi:hypothetical protein